MSGTDNYELPDRHAAQAEGTHPAPCARFCEANAYEIEIRRLRAEVTQLRNGWNTLEVAYRSENERVIAERDDLIGTIKSIKSTFPNDYECHAKDICSEAIAKHKGEKHE